MHEVTQPSVPTGAPEESEVERLAREIADLRAEHRTELEALRSENRAALELVRAQVLGQHASSEPPAAAGPRASAKRLLGRRRPTGSSEGEASGLMSRRRLFGLLGGAAAVGTGLAVAGSTLTAGPAFATGDMVIDASNTGTGTTDLSSSTAGIAMTVEATGTNGSGISGSAGTGGTGVHGNSGSGTGVNGGTQSGYGVSGTSQGGVAVFGTDIGASGGTGVMGNADGVGGIGVLAKTATGDATCLKVQTADPGAGGVPLLIEASGSGTGPPTGNGYALGSFWVDSAGVLWQCVVAGTVSTAGTWISLSAPLVTLASPVRVYDSRAGFLPSTSPKTPITAGSTVTLDVTNNSSGVPDTASAVLGNLTVTNSGNGYLTVYNAALGSAPATSSINLGTGVTLANNFTSACNPGHNIKVTCGGPGPTDFIIDIVGYYP
jgi:hypothetical protein